MAPARATTSGSSGVEGIEPVHAVAGRTGDAEGIDEKNVLPGITAGAGGDGIVLTFEVEDEGRARIIQEVGDDGADAFAGAGGRTGEDVTVLPEASIRQGGPYPGDPCSAASRGNEHIRRGGRCEMIGRGRFVDFAEMGCAVGARRLGRTEDREDGQPAFLETCRHEALAADEEDSEEGEPEQGRPNAIRQEADREQKDHRQPAECGGQDEEEGAFERGPKPVKRHARLEADQREKGADGEEAEQPVWDDGKLATGARQIAGLGRVAGDGGLQDAELPVGNRGMIRAGCLGDRRCGGRCIVGAVRSASTARPLTAA